MKFKAEHELVEAIKASVISVYKQSEIKIFEEVSLGYGIADIVICNIKPQAHLKTNLEESLNILDINIFSIIQKHNNISILEIVNITRCPKRLISKSLDKLLNCEYILKNCDGFMLNKCYDLPFKNNFAIEAKLKDWKKALKQAYRYKWFAEYSFVVLDSYYSKPALKNIESFKKYNVGLASITTDGVLSRHFTPGWQQPFDTTMQMLFSEKIKAQDLDK